MEKMKDEEIRDNLLWLMRAGGEEQKKYYLNYEIGAKRLATDIYRFVLAPLGW